MAFVYSDAVLDAGLNHVADNTVALLILSAAPNGASNTVGAGPTVLAYKIGLNLSALTPADNAGTGGGRKLSITAQTGFTAIASGTGTHLALTNSPDNATFTGDTCHAVTELNPDPSITSGETWDMSVGIDLVMKDPLEFT